MADRAAAVPIFPLANLEQHVDALRKTCHETGLFYLRLDDAEACERCAAAAKDFFDSDDATKAICSYEASPAFRGYMRLGVENTAGVIDAREQIELGREDGICDGVAQRLVGANRWPDDDGKLRGACEPWLAAMSAAAARVTRAAAALMAASQGSHAPRSFPSSSGQRFAPTSRCATPSQIPSSRPSSICSLASMTPAVFSTPNRM